MAELKHNFTAGKMNLDLDERLVPNGEYREATNVQVATSEGSNLGTVQNLLSNYRLPQNLDYNSSYICVGSIADEKNDSLYWFIAALNDWTPNYNVNTSNDPFPASSTNPGNYSQYNSKDLSAWFKPDVLSDKILKYSVKENQDNPIEVVVNDIKKVAVNVLAINDTFINGPQYYLDYESIQTLLVGMQLESINIVQQNGQVFDTFAYPNDGPFIETIDFVTGGITLNIDDVPGIFSNYNIANNIVSFVFKSGDVGVLNFDPTRNNITGINIIDDMLFWTDNHNEPKKINIPDCIQGSQIDTYTRLVNPERNINFSDNIPLTLEHVTAIRKAPTKAPTLILGTGRDYSQINASPPRHYTGVVSVGVDQPGLIQSDDIISSDGLSPDPVDFSGTKVGDKLVLRIDEDIYGNNDFELLWKSNSVVVLKEFDDSSPPSPPSVPITDFTIKARIIDVISSNDFEAFASDPIEIEVEVIAMAGFPPGVLTGQVSRKYAIDLFQNTEKLFEFKFPRFATRYKYKDGQYSSFSPFTPIAFVPGSFDYHPKKGYNVGMTNQLTELKITNFRLNDIPLDVEEIDILYKEEASPNVYLIDSINNRQASFNEDNWNLNEYVVTDETINATIPSNQLLRAYDNVPKKALAQEVTGSRIVYGNYKQGFDLVVKDGGDLKPYSPEFRPILFSHNDSLGFKTNQSSSIKSIKSLREYQVGVVFLDKYGRETPVISNPSGTFKVEKDRCGVSNRLRVGFKGKQPENMEFFQFYIKETSGEYYNMAMSRWYDARDNNVWLSFPSSDRNKIDLDTFLILKKPALSNTPVLDKARYKVIAIENEAPDYIKTEVQLVNKAKHSSNASSSSGALFDTTGALSDAPISGRSTFRMNYKKFKSGAGSDLIKTAENGELYVSFDNDLKSGTSDRYRIVSVTTDRDKTPIGSPPAQTVSAEDAKYYIKIDGIFGDDMNFITDDATGASINEILEFTNVNIFLYKVDNKPQFDGRFFVKIHRNDVFDQHVILDQDLTGTNFRTTRSIDVYMMREADHHEVTHSAKATGHGYEHGSDQLVTAGSSATFTAPTEVQSAYSGLFGRYACYFRKYNFGNSNPSKIGKYDGKDVNDYSTGATFPYDPSSTGYYPSTCRYRFNTFSFDRGGIPSNFFFGLFDPTSTTSYGPGTVTDGHWYPIIRYAFSGLSLDGHGWADEYWCYTGISMSTAEYFYGFSTVPPIGNLGVTYDKARNYLSSDYVYGGTSYKKFTFGADTGINIDNFLFKEFDSLRRQEEVWFIDYGTYRGSIGSSDDHDWSILPGSNLTANNNPKNGRGIFSGSADDPNDREFGMHLTLGPIVHGEKSTITTPLAYDSAAIISTGSASIVPNVWNIGDVQDGNPYYADAETKQLMDGIKDGASWRWREDPNETVFTIGLGGVKHSRRMRYWGGYNYDAADPYTTALPSWYDKVDYAIDTSSDPLPPAPVLTDVPSTRFGAAHLSPNFNKTWKLENFHDESMGWIPTAGPTTGLSNEIGPITNGLSCTVTTIGSGQVANNATDIDEYHIIVTKTSFESATSSSGVLMNITPGLIITKYDTTSLTGEVFNTSGGIDDPYLAIRKIEQRVDGNYKIFLTGYLEALDITHCFDPGASKTIHIAQATMNGYSENSAQRISIQKGATGNGAYTDSPSTGPTGGGNVSATPCLTLLYPVGYTMEFVEPWLEGIDFPENPAIWETEPKDVTDLDIYYAASDMLPLNLNSENLRTLLQLDQDDRHIPMGTLSQCTIQQNTSWFSTTSAAVQTAAAIPTGTKILAIENDTIWIDHTFPNVSPNLTTYFNPNLGPPYISSSYRKIDIFLPDGSIVTMRVDHLIPDSSGALRGLRLRPRAYQGEYTLNWHNCYSFLNGVESNRIRDNFNLPFIGNGVQASTTVEATAYKEEHRKYGLIFSGIYNSISNVNDLNQFITAEKITKDINPTYGSIQKLHTRDSDLVTLCEDKILKILANKDAVFNADGNPQLTANINVLGQTIPFVGEYGISKNPESFASESYRAYFTDKQRGAVIRLSRDGLTPISDHGMKDWFRDNLRLSNKIIGSHDDKKGEYNVALKSKIISIDGDTDIYNNTFQGNYVVSFKENVKGWVSFKSFTRIESGVSMANDYYSFWQGDIYEHHSELETPRYNTFYGNSTSSKITVLFNEDPGVVKSFKALNYEGSQAKVSRPRDAATGNLVDDGQYYNFEDLNGWYTYNMFTDMQEGGSVEFIKKENKWFNYVKGLCVLKTDGLSFEENAFNYQGIGKIRSTSFRLPDTTVPGGQSA